MVKGSTKKPSPAGVAVSAFYNDRNGKPSDVQCNPHCLTLFRVVWPTACRCCSAKYNIPQFDGVRKRAVGRPKFGHPQRQLTNESRGIDNLASETKKGLREAALKGLHTGGYAPFGWDVVGEKGNRHYQINELEAGYVRRLFNAAQKGEGFTALIEEMAAAGIRGKRGKPIKYPQFYEILRNEKYTGVYLYSPTEAAERDARRTKDGAIRIENGMPAIIGKEQFMEVQKIVEERKHAGRKAGYLCSGLVYCRCGAKMHGFTSKRKRHEYPYFSCSAKCDAPVVHMEDVDDVAIRYVRELLTPENQQRVADALRLLIERINVNPEAGEGETKEKTAFSMESTLKTVLGNNGLPLRNHYLTPDTWQ